VLAATDEAGEFYALGQKLLQQAIAEERTDRIAIEEEG